MNVTESKHWKWLPGMRVVHVKDFEVTGDSGTYLSLGTWPLDITIQWDDHHPRGSGCSWSSPQNFRPAPHVGDYADPDLTDPATIGCVEHLAREAWGFPMEVDEGFGVWSVYVYSAGDRFGSAIPVPIAASPTRGEAWAAALLAAP